MSRKDPRTHMTAIEVHECWSLERRHFDEKMTQIREETAKIFFGMMKLNGICCASCGQRESGGDCQRALVTDDYLCNDWSSVPKLMG